MRTCVTTRPSSRLFMTYRHGTLIAGSVFITIMGGVYFLYLILRSKGL